MFVLTFYQDIYLSFLFLFRFCYVDDQLISSLRGLSKLYRVAIDAFLSVDQRNLLLPVHTYPDIF